MNVQGLTQKAKKSPMKTIIILAVIGIGGYFAWKKFGKGGLKSGAVTKPEDVTYDPYKTGKLTEGAVNEWGVDYVAEAGGIDNVIAQLPEDFDWVKYVKNNKDLQDVNIDTFEEAAAHYVAHGANESFRSYK